MADANHRNTEADMDRERADAETSYPASGAPAGQGDELLGRFDQLGSIVSRGFELVETSITLGINLASRLSSALQVQTADMMEGQRRPYAEQQPMPYEGPGVGEAPVSPYQQPPGGAEPAPSVSYVANRLPLFPGSPVRVSFTINNDSGSSPRELRLQVEGFVGELHGATFEATDFSVIPETSTIAPMDFEKFTLVGNIPPGAVNDAYGGWIVVSAEENLRIPIRLLVTGQS